MLGRLPTGAPLTVQGRFHSLRDGLEPRASVRPCGRHKGRSGTCPAVAGPAQQRRPRGVGVGQKDPRKQQESRETA